MSRSLVGLESRVPTIFGVLTTDTADQAVARAGAGSGNKGWEAGLAALEMIHVLRGIDGGGREPGAVGGVTSGPRD